MGTGASPAAPIAHAVATHGDPPVSQAPIRSSSDASRRFEDRAADGRPLGEPISSADPHILGLSIGGAPRVENFIPSANGHDSLAPPILSLSIGELQPPLAGSPVAFAASLDAQARRSASQDPLLASPGLQARRLALEDPAIVECLPGRAAVSLPNATASGATLECVPTPHSGSPARRLAAQDPPLAF